MKEGEADSAGEGLREEAPDEQAMLRYEEHITELLLTVARLHGKVEHLERRRGSRDVEDFSDLGSEYTASLPRCQGQFTSAAMMLPPAVCAEEAADLFLDVHKALTSLEKRVVSHRSCIPSAQAEREGYTQVAESLRKFQERDKVPLAQMGLGSPAVTPEASTDELCGYEKEISLYEERNAALRVALDSGDEDLARCKASVSTYQEERAKLQRKVKELQDALSEAEALSAGGAASPAREGEPRGLQDPSAASRSFSRSFPSAARAHFAPRGPPFAEVQADDMAAGRQRFCGFIETLKRLNQLLSAALQECKSGTERISMLLGRRESDSTALHLAAQYSEDCLQAYEVLLSLSGVERHPRMEAVGAGAASRAGDPGSPSAELRAAVMGRAMRALQGHGAIAAAHGGNCTEQRSPEPGCALEEAEERKVLREYIRLLRAAQAAVKLPPAHQSPPGADSAVARLSAGIGAKMVEVRNALQKTLPTEAAKPTAEKGRLVKELQAVREALADLNTTLHLGEKEKRVLELQTYTHRAREAASLLTIQILQGELDECWGRKSGSSRCSSSSSSSSENSFSRGHAPIRTSKETMSALPENAGQKQPDVDRKAQMLDILATSARNNELREQILTLLGELEESSLDCKEQETQQTDLARDFFKAHSALVLAYRNARRKQEAQVCQLETQMGLMHWRQAGQLQSLVQTFQRLEGRAGGQDPHVG